MNDESAVTTPQSLGACLRRARRGQGLSQADVATELGISQAYVSEMETGKDSLAMTRLFDFMRLTGMTLHAETSVTPTRDVVQAADRSALEEACRRFGISELAVFGSVARGEAFEGSDIDLLYTLNKGARIGWAINDFSDELERILGRPVDLVSRQSLHPHMSATVLAEAQVIYAS